MAEHVDDMAFLMAMQSMSNVHGPASYLQNTGFLLPGFPSAGSWISCALGRLTDDFPAFIVMPDMRGLPDNGMGNFSSSFLPVSHQAYFQGISQATRTRCLPIANANETFKA